MTGLPSLARVRTAARERWSTGDGPAILAIALALAARLAISHWSEGSPDVVFFEEFANRIASQGMLETYADPLAVHSTTPLSWVTSARGR
jgi:hypothetical protein